MGKGFGGFGGMNINNLMKQAQKMQQDMVKKQEELKTKEFDSTAGGGAIKVVVTGERKIKEITIKPEVVDPEDVETLQDLIMIAVNGALEKAEEASTSEMSQLTGGMNLPGMF